MTARHSVHRSVEWLSDLGDESFDELGQAHTVQKRELVHDDYGVTIKRDCEIAGATWQGEVVLATERENGSVEGAAQKLDPVRWDDFATKLTALNNVQRNFWHSRTLSIRDGLARSGIAA
jgi:hypothetical protein